MKTNFNTKPSIKVNADYPVIKGWRDINLAINGRIGAGKNIVVETYQGVIFEEISSEIEKGVSHTKYLDTRTLMKSEDDIKNMVYPDVTDDRIFGFMTRLNIEDYFDDKKLADARLMIANKEDSTLIIGPGASLLMKDPDLLVYADMARWEIQLRMRRHEVDNLGLKNRDTEDWMLLYKQGYFVDWRVCDRLKKKLFNRIDLLLDTNIQGAPKMVDNEAILKGYQQCIKQPFSVVPFFDPGPWGGQWMKEVCNLDKTKENYAWCFNCVPEEESLLLEINNEIIEVPSINVVFRHPKELLGDAVHARFGAEFPIRFDFLDTMDGGNLSLQVHPLTEYIQEKFGLNYTQDESYYMMDAKEDAIVYLGLKEGVDPEACLKDLEDAKETGVFKAEKHIQTWPVKKHDHVLIPAGTIHCSGANSMVLEISATPYIFTFKLWDWGRLGMDGKPRPINLEHGKNVIQWDRTTEWTRKNLVNRVEKVAEGNDWVEERTGLHEREFIETRRHWFTGKVEHTMKFGVEVICLVEGDEVTIESPENRFDPFILNYAEVVIMPANIHSYTVTPFGKAAGKKCGTLKAYIRS